VRILVDHMLGRAVDHCMGVIEPIRQIDPPVGSAASRIHVASWYNPQYFAGCASDVTTLCF
jgi:hypothetical protein